MKMPDLTTMLTYRRPEGSRHQRKFCNRFLKPVMGEPDAHGNYHHHIPGPNSNLLFCAHHDTVHSHSGRQTIYTEDGFLYSAQDCLGADCTTGVWLILEMIEAGVSGHYVVHAAEEVGCKGSSALVRDNPAWLGFLDAVISFDRKGTGSIITEQMRGKTASDEFAHSLADALGLNMAPDPTGSYTDSNEYAHIVPECTNISVGYYDQHTANERQDLDFAFMLRDALISADFSTLKFKREPGDFDSPMMRNWYLNYGKYGKEVSSFKKDPLVELIEDHPRDIARWLEDLGITYEQLCEELGIYTTDYVFGRF